MSSTPAGAQTGASRQRLRIVLSGGETISSAMIGNETAAFRELDDLIDDLASDRYVRIGDDTIVRSDEIRIIQLAREANDQGGLLGGLKSTLSGGNEIATAERKDADQTGSSGQQPWLGSANAPGGNQSPSS